MPTNGYYSLIQYVPNAERAEGANIGILIFSPQTRVTISAFSSVHPPRLRDLCKEISPNSYLLTELVESLRHRISQDAPEDLPAYIRSIGRETGKLRILPPRAILLLDSDVTGQELCRRLVGEAFKREVITRRIPEFESLLGEPGMSNLIQRNVKVPIPGRAIQASYQWMNGKPNVVVHTRFRDDASAVDMACQWGAKGSLLLHNPVDNKSRQLAIVYKVSPSVSAKISRDVDRILSDFPVDRIPESSISQYIEKVRSQAH